MNRKLNKRKNYKRMTDESKKRKRTKKRKEGEWKVKERKTLNKEKYKK